MIEIIAPPAIHTDCEQWVSQMGDGIVRINAIFPVGSAMPSRMHVFPTVASYHASPIGEGAKKLIKSDRLPPWFLGNTNLVGFHIVHRKAADLAVPDGFLDETLLHEYCHSCNHNEYPFCLGESFDKWFVESIAVYVSGRTPKQVYRDECPSYRDLSSGMRYYRFGYFVGQYVEHTFGIKGLNDLLRHQCDVGQAFGLSDDAFDAGWQALVPNRPEAGAGLRDVTARPHRD